MKQLSFYSVGLCTFQIRQEEKEPGRLNLIYLFFFSDKQVGLGNG